MKPLILLALLLWPALAHALPLIILAAQYLVTAGFIAAWIGYAVAIAATVYGTASARRKQRAAQSQARAAYNAALQDRTATVLRADPPWRTIYGRAITGGDIVGIFTSDKTGTRLDGSSYTKADALKHLVIVISCRQCQAINEVYLDGVPLGALDGSGFVTTGEFATTATETREITIAASGTSTQPSAVTVLSAWDETLSGMPGTDFAMVAGSYTLTSGNTVITNTGANPLRVSFTLGVARPSVRVQKHLGTPDQAVNAYLTSVVPAEWGANDRLRGLCYAVLTLDLENQRFQAAQLNPTFDISGALLFDPRSGLTVWSDNPALCTRDYLTFEGGFNCEAADIDDARCIAAANACDVPISLTVGASTTVGPTYTCNGVITTEQGKEAVLQDLAECMAGTVSYGAQWLIDAGVWTVPVMALTDDDLHGQLEVVQGGAGMDEAYNTVRGQYVPEGGSAPADFDIYSNAAFVAADGQALYTDVALPFTNHKARCRNLARIFTERDRDGLIVRYPAKLRAFVLQIGDRVTLTSTEYGFAAKTFRVTDWQFGLGAPVQLLLQEDAPGVWDLADAATSDPARNSALPNPWVVALPSGVTISSGTSVPALGDGSLDSRVRVAWAATTDPYLADGSGAMLVRWRRQYRDAVNVWHVLPPVPASEIHTFITGVHATDAITVELRWRNGVGALSEPVYYSHVVADNASTVRTVQIAANAVTTIATGTLSAQAISVSGGIAGVSLLEISATTITKSADSALSLQLSGVIRIVFKGSGFTSGTKKLLAQSSLYVHDAAHALAFTPQTEITWSREEPIHVELGATYDIPYSITKEYAVIAASGAVHVAVSVYAAVSNQLGTFSAIDAISTADLSCSASLEEIKR